jgi:predicted peroxiredoxin
MTNENFFTAVQIITRNNSIKVSFNVPVKDNYSHTHQILIHESNAAVLDELINNGFSLSMCEKGLKVNNYKS